MASFHAHQDEKRGADWLTIALDGWRRLLVLTMVLVLGHVGSWSRLGFRAAGFGTDYQDYHYFLQSLCHRWEELVRRVLALVLQRVLKDQQRVMVAIDDSPTKRYGPKVDVAGTRRDPTPSPVVRSSGIRAGKSSACRSGCGTSDICSTT